METINRAISASGESVQYFAALRARMIADVVRPRVSPSRRSARVGQPLRILDFGCGTGNLTREVAKRFGSSVLTGTDQSDESLAHARKQAGELPILYVTTPPDQLPFGAACFDVVYAQGVFHHIDPSERLHWAREIHRVLAPEGRFFLFEHNPLNPLTTRVVRNTPFDAGVTLLRAREATILLRDAGFQVVKRPVYYFFFPEGAPTLSSA